MAQAARAGGDGGEGVATGKRAKRASSVRSHTSVCVGQGQGQVEQQAQRRLQVEQQQQQQQEQLCETGCQGVQVHPGAQQGCVGAPWQEAQQQQHRHSTELGSAGLSGGSQADCALPVGHMGGGTLTPTAPHFAPSVPSLTAPSPPPYALGSCSCPFCRAAAAAAAATAAAAAVPYSFAHGAPHPAHTIPSFPAPPPVMWPGPCPCAACTRLRGPLAGTPFPFHPPPPPPHTAIHNTASSFPCPAPAPEVPVLATPQPATPRPYPGCPCPACLKTATPASATAARLHLPPPTPGTAPVHATPPWSPHARRAGSVGSAPALFQPSHTPPYPYAYSSHVPPPPSPYTPHPWAGPTAVRPGCPCAACLATTTNGHTPTAGAAADATAAAAAATAAAAARAARPAAHPPPSAGYSAGRPFASRSSGFGPVTGATQGTAVPQPHTCTQAHARLASTASLPALPHLNTWCSHQRYVTLASQPNAPLLQPSQHEQQRRLEHEVQQLGGTVPHGRLSSHHAQGSPQGQGIAHGCTPCPGVHPAGAAAGTPTPFARCPGTAATPVQLPCQHPLPHSHFSSPYYLPGATYASAPGVTPGSAPGEPPAPVQAPPATPNPASGDARDAVKCTPADPLPYQYQPGWPCSGVVAAGVGGGCGEVQLATPRAVATPPACLACSSLGVDPAARSGGSTATAGPGGQEREEGGEAGAAAVVAAMVAAPKPGAMLGTWLPALQPTAVHACGSGEHGGAAEPNCAGWEVLEDGAAVCGIGASYEQAVGCGGTEAVQASDVSQQ